MRRIASRNLLARRSAAHWRGSPRRRWRATAPRTAPTAAMMAAAVCSAKNSPVGAGCRAARGGCRARRRWPKAITGVPQACASTMAMPKSSSAAKTKARAVRVSRHQLRLRHAAAQLDVRRAGRQRPRTRLMLRPVAAARAAGAPAWRGRPPPPGRPACRAPCGRRRRSGPLAAPRLRAAEAARRPPAGGPPARPAATPCGCARRCRRNSRRSTSTPAAELRSQMPQPVQQPARVSAPFDAALQPGLAQVLVLQVPGVAHRAVDVADMELPRPGQHALRHRVGARKPRGRSRTGRAARSPAASAARYLRKCRRAKGRRWMKVVRTGRPPRKPRSPRRQEVADREEVGLRPDLQQLLEHPLGARVALQPLVHDRDLHGALAPRRGQQSQQALRRGAPGVAGGAREAPAAQLGRQAGLAQQPRQRVGRAARRRRRRRRRTTAPRRRRPRAPRRTRRRAPGSRRPWPPAAAARTPRSATGTARQSAASYSARSSASRDPAERDHGAAGGIGRAAEHLGVGGARDGQPHAFAPRAAPPLRPAPSSPLCAARVPTTSAKRPGCQPVPRQHRGVGRFAQDVLAAFRHHADAARVDQEAPGDAAARELRHGEQPCAAARQGALQPAVPGPERGGVGLGRVEGARVVDHHRLPPAREQRRRVAEADQHGTAAARAGSSACSQAWPLKRPNRSTARFGNADASVPAAPAAARAGRRPPPPCGPARP